MELVPELNQLQYPKRFLSKTGTRWDDVSDISNSTNKADITVIVGDTLVPLVRGSSYNEWLKWHFFEIWISVALICRQQFAIWCAYGSLATYNTAYALSLTVFWTNATPFLIALSAL